MSELAVGDMLVIAAYGTDVPLTPAILTYLAMHGITLYRCAGCSTVVHGIYHVRDADQPGMVGDTSGSMYARVRALLHELEDA